MAARFRRWICCALVTAFVVMACAGCRSHLVGMRDVALRFGLAASSGRLDDLVERVHARLSAAEIAAEVHVGAARELTVRVDEAVADEVERLVLWRGGLSVAVAEGGDTLAEVDPEQATADGPRVLVPLASEAEGAVRGACEDAASPPLQVTRDGKPVGTVACASPLRGHRMVVLVGANIVAYTDAARLARLLSTPRLPALRALAREVIAPDLLLAGSNLVLPFVLSLAWLYFVRRFDRAQPEPAWLVVGTFLLGAVAAVPAGLVEYGWDWVSPYTNPTLLTFGRSLRAFPLALVGFAVTVGVTEEGAKLLATWSLALHRREFDEPVDGIVYGAAAALGFAAAENLEYLAVGRVGGALVASRAFLSVPGHLFFGSLWGYALGRRLVEPKRRVWPMFLAAAGLHGLFDTCLSIDGAGLGALVVAFVAASIFIVEVRLALRHGPVTRTLGEEVEDRGRKELFRMGSRRVFGAFVGALYLLGACSFVLAAVSTGSRVTVATGLVSATVVALLGWAARGVTSALPLDVVVDDVGVTFAGACVRYREVLRIERRRLATSPRRQEEMMVVCASRRLVLGPASRETMDRVAHALATRLSSATLRG